MRFRDLIDVIIYITVTHSENQQHMNVAIIQLLTSFSFLNFAPIIVSWCRYGYSFNFTSGLWEVPLLLFYCSFTHAMLV